MSKINTCTEWLAVLHRRNPAMSQGSVSMNAVNLEKLLRKTWNLAFEAGKTMNESESRLPPEFENLFKGFNK